MMVILMFLLMALAMVAVNDASSGKERQQTARIHIISDDITTCSLLGLNLKVRGFNAETHPCFALASAAIQQGLCDLVIVDITTHLAEDFEMCCLVRAITDAPVLAISTFAEPQGTALAVEAGADRHLSKPFGIAALIQAVYDALGGNG